MNVHLTPETEARLTAFAANSGVSVDDYLTALLERELPGDDPACRPEIGGDFRKEYGILVYRTGVPMPLSMAEDTLQAIRRQREQDSFGSDSQ